MIHSTAETVNRLMRAGVNLVSCQLTQALRDHNCCQLLGVVRTLPAPWYMCSQAILIGTVYYNTSATSGSPIKGPHVA